MSEVEGFARESIPGRYELLNRLGRYYEEHRVPITDILGSRAPEDIRGHELVTREYDSTGQHLLFDFRRADSLTEARFYPAPVVDGTHPHYQLTEEDKFVLFMDEFGPVEEHRIIVVDSRGRISFARQHRIGPVVSAVNSTIGYGDFTENISGGIARLNLEYFLAHGQPIDADKTKILDYPPDEIETQYRYFGFGVLDRSPFEGQEPVITQATPNLVAVGTSGLARHVINRHRND
jgi:hypothetical protein